MWNWFWEVLLNFVLGGSGATEAPRKKEEHKSCCGKRVLEIADMYFVMFYI
jgi:hypothetical protein